MSHIKQIDKDVLLLGMIIAVHKECNIQIEDVVPNFNQNEFDKLYAPLIKDKQATEDALKYLANDIYKRVAKKFTKG